MTSTGKIPPPSKWRRCFLSLLVIYLAFPSTVRAQIPGVSEQLQLSPQSYQALQQEQISSLTISSPTPGVSVGSQLPAQTAMSTPGELRRGSNGGGTNQPPMESLTQLAETYQLTPVEEELNLIPLEPATQEQTSSQIPGVSEQLQLSPQSYLALQQGQISSPTSGVSVGSQLPAQTAMSTPGELRRGSNRGGTDQPPMQTYQLPPVEEELNLIPLEPAPQEEDSSSIPGVAGELELPPQSYLALHQEQISSPTPGVSVGSQLPFQTAMSTPGELRGSNRGGTNQPPMEPVTQEEASSSIPGVAGELELPPQTYLDLKQEPATQEEASSSIPGVSGELELAGQIYMSTAEEEKEESNGFRIEQSPDEPAKNDAAPKVKELPFRNEQSPDEPEKNDAAPKMKELPAQLRATTAAPRAEEEDKEDNGKEVILYVLIACTAFFVVCAVGFIVWYCHSGRKKSSAASSKLDPKSADPGSLEDGRKVAESPQARQITMVIQEPSAGLSPNSSITLPSTTINDIVRTVTLLSEQKPSGPSDADGVVAATAKSTEPAAAQQNPFEAL